MVIGLVDNLPMVFDFGQSQIVRETQSLIERSCLDRGYATGQVDCQNAHVKRFATFGWLWAAGHLFHPVVKRLLAKVPHVIAKKVSGWMECHSETFGIAGMHASKKRVYCFTNCADVINRVHNMPPYASCSCHCQASHTPVPRHSLTSFTAIALV